MTESIRNKLVRDRFNKQAENFSNWSVTQNTEYSRLYFEFCQMTPDDTLLDISCGSGEYCLYCAPKIARATGIDLSDRMIDLAKHHQRQAGITNAAFQRGDAANVPFEDNAFSIVISKSAFHHYTEYQPIFSQMTRCCEPNGRISIQDIVAYDDGIVDDFFESFERLVDSGHHVTLSKAFIQDLYLQHGVDILSTMEVEVDLNLAEYLTHAVRSEEATARIAGLVEDGLADSTINPYFQHNNDELYFRRNVLVILGRKTGEPE